MSKFEKLAIEIEKMVAAEVGRRCAPLEQEITDLKKKIRKMELAPKIEVHPHFRTPEIPQELIKRSNEPIVVNVKSILSMPKRRKHQEVHRDERTGRVTATTETEETVEEPVTE